MGAEKWNWKDETAHQDDYPKCPIANTPHDHLPDSVTDYRPPPRLSISDEAKEIACIILSPGSYDGLTVDQKKENEAKELLRQERRNYAETFTRFEIIASQMPDLYLLGTEEIV